MTSTISLVVTKLGQVDKACVQADHHFFTCNLSDQKAVGITQRERDTVKKSRQNILNEIVDDKTCLAVFKGVQHLSESTKDALANLALTRKFIDTFIYAIRYNANYYRSCLDLCILHGIKYVRLWLASDLGRLSSDLIRDVLAYPPVPVLDGLTHSLLKTQLEMNAQNKPPPAKTYCQSVFILHVVSPVWL